MDTVEATKMVMSRIQKLDPENASKIMGYILIQDQGDNEMIRLAFGPENLLVSVIKQAKSFLDISSNTSSAPSNQSIFAHRNTPQIVIPSNGFHHINPSSPSSPWSLTGSFSDQHVSHRGSPRPASYASVVNGGGSSASSFYNGFNDPTEEFNSSTNSGQLQFFEDSNNVKFNDQMTSSGAGVGGRSESVMFPFGNESTDVHHHHHLHRRSCSVNDVFLSSGDGNDDVSAGFGGWRPCMYYARGFCKNGTACKFAHGNGGFGDELGLGSSSPAGSPTGKMDAFDDLLRIKAIHQQQQQQQRIAAMAGGGVGVPHFPFNRCINFMNENPRSPSALMMGDEFHKFGRCRPDRSDFGPMGFGSSNSSSRQIYLTFPADSTFKEEDVSNYFSMFGPVQDVRIPYQQKRMFGFVTFMLPETVKAILAKGNPHFVCDSRVLVKPYKEKGKIPDKKHQQQMERGDFSGCLSPTALESAEPFDHIPFGARMFNHEMGLRRKLEERELQQAIEFQDRRLMNLHLNDVKSHQFHRSFSLGDAVYSPTQLNQNLVFPSNDSNEELVSGATIDESDPTVPPAAKEESSDQNDTGKNESFEHALPDNLFASPTKSAIANQTNFSTGMPEAEYGAAIPIHVTSKCQGVGAGYSEGGNHQQRKKK